MSAGYDFVRVITSTTGAGTSLVLGTIGGGGGVTSYRDFTGIPDGTVVPYGIEDSAANAREAGYGVVSSTGTVFTRTFTSSTSGGFLSLTGTAQIFIDFTALEMAHVQHMKHSLLGGI